MNIFTLHIEKCDGCELFIYLFISDSSDKSPKGPPFTTLILYDVNYVNLANITCY